MTGTNVLNNVHLHIEMFIIGSELIKAENQISLRIALKRINLGSTLLALPQSQRHEGYQQVRDGSGGLDYKERSL